MITAEELRSFFANVDEDKRALAFDCIDEYVYFLEQIQSLKKLPCIRVSKKDPTKQEITPAAKLIKEYSSILDNKRRLLLMVLYRVENSAADELLSKLSEFE